MCMCFLLIFSIQVVMRVQITMQATRNISIRFKSFGSPNWRVLYFAKSKIFLRNGWVQVPKTSIRSPSLRMYSPPQELPTLGHQSMPRPNCVPWLGGGGVIVMLLTYESYEQWKKGKPGWLGYIYGITLASYMGIISYTIIRISINTTFHGSRMVFRWPNWQELQQSTPAFWARLIPHVVMGEQGRHGDKCEDGVWWGVRVVFKLSKLRWKQWTPSDACILMQGNGAMISQTTIYLLVISCTTSEVSNVLDY